MNIHDTDKWGMTQVRISKCTYTWAIRNFSYLRTKTGEEVQSPDFSIGSQKEANWYLKLYLKGINENYKDYLAVYLVRKSGSEHNIDGEYSISILNEKKEKFLEAREECEYTENFSSWGFPAFVKSDTLLDKANNLLVNDTLTLHCEITIVLGTISVSSETEKIARPNKSPDFHHHFEKLLFNERFSDLKLVTSCGKQVPAHKNILAARSPTFSAMFEHDMLENQSNVVSIPDIEHDVLREMLRFVYAARVENVENIASELIVAADKYGIEGLKEMCEEVLCDNISVDNVVQVLLVADRHSIEHLKSRAINFIRAHIKDVIETDGYKSLVLKTSVLTDIIKAIM